MDAIKPVRVVDDGMQPAGPPVLLVLSLGDAVRGTEGGAKSNQENKRQIYA